MGATTRLHAERELLQNADISCATLRIITETKKNVTSLICRA